MEKRNDEPAVPKMEDILEDIGGYGTFQKIFSFLAMFPQLSSAMIIFSPIFTADTNVPIYCTNQTVFQEDYRCNLNCVEVDDGRPIFSSVVQEWNLVCGYNWIPGAFTSGQMMGMMTGAMVSSLVAESFGRRIGFFFTTLTMGVFGLLPALAINPVTYAIARFLAGFGDGGTLVVYLVHLTEFLTPAWRSICGFIPFWCFGEMLLGLLAYLIPNWRLLSIVTASPVFIVLFFYPFILESPRWLLTQKRTKEAHQVLAKIAVRNLQEPPSIAVVEQLQSAILREDSDNLTSLQRLKQIWANGSVRRHVAILSWVKTTCAIVLYGVSFNVSSLSGSPYVNIACMGLFDLVAAALIPGCCNQFGRKKTLVASMSLAAACLVTTLVLMLCTEVPVSHPMILTISSLLGRFGVACGFGAVRLLCLESFPTTLRSSCMGLATFAGYFGGIIAPQTAFLSQFSAVIPNLIFSCLAVSSSILSLYLNEMTGEPLQDTAKN